MKKKGFTLVELLGVIVVLAIIALIAVPMILGMIEKAKVGAFKASVENAFDAANLYEIENLSTNMKIGVSVKDLKLKSNTFKEGIIYKGEKEKLKGIGISDGVYCASGEPNNIEVKKGECELTDEEKIKIVAQTMSSLDSYASSDTGELMMSYVEGDMKGTIEMNFSSNVRTNFKNKITKIDSDFEEIFNFPPFNGQQKCVYSAYIDSNGDTIIKYQKKSYDEGEGSWEKVPDFDVPTLGSSQLVNILSQYETFEKKGEGPESYYRLTLSRETYKNILSGMFSVFIGNETYPAENYFDIYVDEETNRVIKLAMSCKLSVDEEGRAGTITLDMTANYSEFNQVEELTIPQEVIDAVENK